PPPRPAPGLTPPPPLAPPAPGLVGRPAPLRGPRPAGRGPRPGRPPRVGGPPPPPLRRLPQRMTPVLEVRDVRKTFSSGSVLGGRRTIPAVDGVSFSLARGRTTALLGESGCGKSTLARTIAHLYPADAGQILLLGQRVQGL